MPDEPKSAARLMHVSDFPRELHDEVADHLALSSVGFSTIRIADGVEHSSASGSGTLIRLTGRLAILTADHVAEQLQAADRVSLLVDWRGGLRRCAYDRGQLSIARLARGADDGNAVRSEKRVERMGAVGGH